jgi:hypothetical protein
MDSAVIVLTGLIFNLYRFFFLLQIENSIGSENHQMAGNSLTIAATGFLLNSETPDSDHH